MCLIARFLFNSTSAQFSDYYQAQTCLKMAILQVISPLLSLQAELKFTEYPGAHPGAWLKEQILVPSLPVGQVFTNQKDPRGFLQNHYLSDPSSKTSLGLPVISRLSEAHKPRHHNQWWTKKYIYIILQVKVLY